MELDLEIETKSARKQGWRDRVVILSMVGSLVVILAFVAISWVSYLDARDKGEREARSLMEASSSYITNQLNLWTLALELTQQAWVDGEERWASPKTQNLVNYIGNEVGFIGALIILDRNGDIVASPMSFVQRTGNFADRDYFRVHLSETDSGVYISQPYLSPLRNGDPSIALSRRLEDANGAFAGVAIVEARLESIKKLFDQINLGENSIISLFSTSGTMLVRRPSLGTDSDIGLDLSNSPNFKQMLSKVSGSFEAVAVTDQVRRVYIFTRIPQTNLIIAVGPAKAQIFADWYVRLVSYGALATAMCASLILVAVLLKKELGRRENAEARLKLLARTDGLTKLANRRRFNELLQNEVRRAVRSGNPIAVVMIDADHFKRINDEKGHAVGDIALQVLARCLTDNLRRSGDLAARYGGEEFVLLLPETTDQQALTVADAMRIQFEKDTAANSSIGRSCTISIGINATQRGAPASADSLVSGADAALYRAKQEGRNRAVIHQAEAIFS